MNKFLLVILALALLAVAATSFRHHGPHHGRRHHNKTNNTNSTRPQRLEAVKICYNDKHCVSVGKSLQAVFNSTRFNRTRRFNNTRFNRPHYRRFNSTRFNKTNTTRPQRLEIQLCVGPLCLKKLQRADIRSPCPKGMFCIAEKSLQAAFNKTRFNRTRPQRLQIQLCVGPLCLKKLQGFLPKNFFSNLKNKTTNAIKNVSEKVQNIVKPNKLEGAKTDALKKLADKVTGKVCVGKVCVEKSLESFLPRDFLSNLKNKTTSAIKNVSEKVKNIVKPNKLQGAKTDALKKLADKITGEICIGKVCIRKD